MVWNYAVYISWSHKDRCDYNCESRGKSAVDRSEYLWIDFKHLVKFSRWKLQAAIAPAL